MIVQTKDRRIQGICSDGTNLFLGIPYALPPLGKRRFRRAVCCKKSNELWQAIHFRPKAPQPNIGLVRAENDLSESEDCLYLNIWASASPEKNKPVLVWIHGGAFTFGEAAAKLYDGTAFAKNGNLIFISIQYRLGILGFSDFSFLNSSKNDFETNVGLSDQIMALKWIRRNISCFGGNPNKITLMGESAGASSILCLMASPAAKGLFHQAICQSPVTSAVQNRENARFWANQALGYLGITPDEPEMLKTISFERTNEAAKNMLATFTSLTPGKWPIGPTVDGDLLPLSIEEAFHKGEFNSVPLVLGTTKDEAANFVREIGPWLPSNPEQLDHLFLQNPKLEKETILNWYPNYPAVSAFRTLGRDFCFVAGLTLVGDANAEKAPTFCYRFDYETMICKKMNLGAFHGFEIPFVFSNLDAELRKLLVFDLADAKALASWMHKAWISFVKNGNPNFEGQVLWQAYSKDMRKTLLINLEPTLAVHPDRSGFEIWGKQTWS